MAAILRPGLDRGRSSWCVWICNSECIRLFNERFDERYVSYITDVLGRRRAPSFVGFFFGDGVLQVFIGMTVCLSILFLVLFPFAYGYDAGWRRALGLVATAYLCDAAYGVAAELLGFSPSFAVTLNLVMLALILLLALQVTWFGLLGAPSE